MRQPDSERRADSERRGLPWGHIMWLGLGVLKLPPAQFWAMTLKELQAACGSAPGGGFGDAPPSRSGLEALMMRFPDRAAPHDRSPGNVEEKKFV